LGQGTLSIPSLSPSETHVAVLTSTGVLVYETGTLELAWADSSGTATYSAWSADDGLLAVSFANYPVIIVWDAATGTQRNRFETGADTVTSLDLTPDGKYIITGAEGGVATIWDAATGEEVQRLVNLQPIQTDRVTLPISSVRGVLSPDGKLYGTFYRDSREISYQVFNDLLIWEIPSGRLVKVINDPYGPHDFTWSPDSSKMVVQDYNASGASLWSMSQDKSLGGLRTAQKIAWSPDSSKFAAADYYGLTIYEAATMKPLFEVSFDGNGPEDDFTIAWSADDNQVVLHDDTTNRVDIYDTTTWEVTRQIEGVIGTGVYSRDTNRTYTLHGDIFTSIDVWDLNTGTKLASLADGINADAISLDWSPDGKRIAAQYTNRAYGYNQTVIWDVPSQSVATILAAPGRPVWSPDGQSLAVVCCEFFTLFDTTSWSPRGVISNQVYPGAGPAWSPDSQKIAYADRDGKVLIHDAYSADLLLTLPATSFGPGGCDRVDIAGIAWSGDGKWIATSSGCSEQSLWLWDAATGTLVKQIGPVGGRSSYLGFGGDNKTLRETAQETDKQTSGILGGGRPVGDPWLSIWQLDQATKPDHIPIALMHPPDGAPTAWSPDGTLVAGANPDGTVVVYDATTGEITMLLPGHARSATVAFNPDGNLLASASQDGTIIIWDVSR
jgi:WD40 repeat protein